MLMILLTTAFACKQQEPPASDADPVNEEKKVQTEETAKGPSRTEIKTNTGKAFWVETQAEGSGLMDITISAKGYGENDETWHLEGTDPLTNSFIADLDSNGFDELYLITTSAGSGSYATIYGYASNKDKSVTPIYIPEISENDLKKGGLFEGYMGHDSIFIVGAALKRAFPKYEEGDANCCPTGGKTILTYKLKAGEASWQLQATRP